MLTHLLFPRTKAIIQTRGISNAFTALLLGYSLRSWFKTLVEEVCPAVPTQVIWLTDPWRTILSILETAYTRLVWVNCVFLWIILINFLNINIIKINHEWWKFQPWSFTGEEITITTTRNMKTMNSFPNIFHLIKFSLIIWEIDFHWWIVLQRFRCIYTKLKIFWNFIVYRQLSRNAFIIEQWN